MIDPKLEQIIVNSPSVIRNSIGIRIVKLLAWLLSVALLIIGFSFLLNSFLEHQFMDWLMVDEVFQIDDLEKAQSIRLMRVLGVVFILISGMLFFMVKLSKMVLKRNKFAFDIAMWREDKMAEMKKAEAEKNKTNTTV